MNARHRTTRQSDKGYDMADTAKIEKIEFTRNELFDIFTVYTLKGARTYKLMQKEVDPHKKSKLRDSMKYSNKMRDKARAIWEQMDRDSILFLI
jgi:hypothetical protein